MMPVPAGPRESPAALRDGLASATPLLRLGYAIPVVFFLTTVLCGLMQGDYNHLTRQVSDLGAIGTKSQHVFTAGLLLCSMLSILFIAGLRRACRAIGVSAVPVYCIIAYSVSIAGAAVFPLPLRMHLFMGMPSLLLILSPIFSLALWTGTPNLQHVRVLSVLALAVMLSGFLVYVPDVLPGLFGLKQRLFHIGWSIWFCSLSYMLSSYHVFMLSSLRAD